MWLSGFVKEEFNYTKVYSESYTFGRNCCPKVRLLVAHYCEIRWYCTYIMDIHKHKTPLSGSNPKADARCTVVMVTYNSAHLLERCFENLCGRSAVLVVDNASRDSSVSKVREIAPKATIITNEINEGFGKAANKALNEVKTEFAVLVSPDCLIQKGVMAQLVVLADRWENAAIISPILVEEDGRKTWCHDQDLFSRAGMSNSRSDEPFPSGDLCAGFVQNAVSLVRMSALRSSGFFDERIFLFYEDDDLCIRLRRDGWNLILSPDLLATHLSGTSSSLNRTLLMRRRYYHMAWSRIYLERKYKGSIRGFILGFKNLIVFSGKLLFALVVLNHAKIIRDSARLWGTVAILFGLLGYSLKENDK